jgi:hypothetical protein
MTLPEFGESEMSPMRRAILLIVTLVGLSATGLAEADQSGRVRRVNGTRPPDAGSADPSAATPDSTAADANAGSTTAQPAKNPDPIAIVVKCNAKYDGGSLNIAMNQKLTVTVKDGILALHARGSSFEIPTAQITELSYSQKSRSRTAEGIGVGAVNRTAGVLLGNTRTTSHYIQITWAGNPPGGVSLKIDKDDIRGVLAALEAATGIQSRSGGASWQ